MTGDLQVPDDLQKCQEMIVQMHVRMQQMEIQLEQFIRSKFGSKAESLDPGQLRLFGAPPAPETESAETATETATEKSGRSHGRRKPAANLPRRRFVYELPEDERTCCDCKCELEVIGEDVSEQYDYTPASIEVIEHVRLKYACKQCEEKIEVAAKPAVPIEKGLAAAGMLAHVATSKFADHLPLHRLEGILKRSGAIIAKSTMCDWMAATARILTPLYDVMKAEVLSSQIIWTDDTPVKMQDRNHEKNIREARVWTYSGDRRHYFTVFDFTESRKRDGPQKFLSGYKGFLQADAFAGYDCIYAGGNVVEVACHAHARRKFFDALSTNSFLCTVALNIIRYLYLIERKAATLSDEERAAYRCKFALPALRAYKKWLDFHQLRALPKSPFAKAIFYSLNNWEALCRYVENGELTIDNNRSERNVRPIAIGRKNWLFAGSREGGRTAAIITSFIATCKAYGVNPYSYLKDVISKLTSGQEINLRGLLPDLWKASNS